MATEELVELNRRVDILIALTLCTLERRTDPHDVIGVLGRFDIESREIASILGMTSSAVRAARHRLRRAGRKPRKKGKK